MKKLSSKQSERNKILERIKKTKPNQCIFCRTSCSPYVALCHLFPKGIYGQYYTEVQNVWKGHDTCHRLFDDGTDEYRAGFSHIVEIVRGYATEQEIYRHFGL